MFYFNQFSLFYANVDVCFYQYGQIHRDCEQPAVISANGQQIWYQNGNLIRRIEVSNTTRW